MALPVDVMIPKKIQPIAKRHFVLAIEGIDYFLVKTVSLPQITTEEITLNYINTTRYIAGKTTYGTMSVTLHQAVSPQAAQQVMNWIRSCYESVSGRGGYADFYKRDIQIKVLDPVGTPIQLWDIRGAFLTETNFNDMSYDSTAELSEIALTIRYDACILQF